MVFKAFLPELSKKFSIKIGMVFARLPLTPNMWTMISLVPALIGLYFLLQQNVLYGLVFFVLAAIMDAIDGGVARVRGQVTNYGAYLDGMMDRFVEAALLFGLMFVGYPDWIIPGWMWLALMLFFGTTMTTLSVAYAHHKNVIGDPQSLRKIRIVLERPARTILIFLSMLSLSANPLYATYAMALGVALAVFTVFDVMLQVKNLKVVS